MKPVYPKYVSPSTAAGIFGVTTQTLRRWAKTGKINFIKTPGGQYRFDVAPFVTALPAETAKPVKVKTALKPVQVDLEDAIKAAPKPEKVSVSKPEAFAPLLAALTSEAKAQTAAKKLDAAALMQKIEGLASASMR